MRIPLNRLRRRLGRFAVACLAACIGGLPAPPARAQYTEIETHFKRPSASEERSLREVLAEPVPLGTTYLHQRRHFTEKNNAAIRLGDDRAREQVLRQAVGLLAADAAWKMELGQVLLARGEITQGNEWRAAAVRSASYAEVRAIYMAHVARDLVQQLDDPGAKQMIHRVRDLVQNNKIGPRWPASKLVEDQRALAHCAMVESMLEERASRHDAAIRAAYDAEDYARSAWRRLSSSSDPQRGAVAADIGLTLSRRLEAQRAARRYEDAERTLNEYVRASRDYELPPIQQADLYLLAAEIRFDKRVFGDVIELGRVNTN
jgi:hypothetical protein